MESELKFVCFKSLYIVIQSEYKMMFHFLIALSQHGEQIRDILRHISFFSTFKHTSFGLEKVAEFIGISD